MASPDDRKYAKTHEWYAAEGDVVTVGITQFAVDELTDITFVDLPSQGAHIDAGGTFGEIESVKATSELNSAIGGEVVAVNERLADDPGLVNGSPYDEGWMIRVRSDDLAPLDALMSAADYDRMLADG